MNVARRPTSILERLSALGAGTQAFIPGLYAWVVTVASVGFAAPLTSPQRWTSLLGLLSLAGGVVMTRRGSRFGSIVSVWGLVLAALVTWSLTLATGGTLPVDFSHAVAGLLGWGLFGFASAAPAIQRPLRDEASPLVTKDPRELRAARRMDASLLGASALMAALLQTLGWETKTFERALLVRLTLLCAGLAVIGAGADVAVSRHARGAKRKGVVVRATLPIVFTVLFAIAAVLVAGNAGH